MKIGEVAEASGVPAKTIRYYEGIGLIEAAERTESGYRDYDQRDLETLRFIARARNLGFRVREVADLLTLWRDRQRSSAQVKSVAQEHLDAVDARIAELQSLRATLADLIERCHGDSRPDCPILKDLEGRGA